VDGVNPYTIFFDWLQMSILDSIKLKYPVMQKPIAVLSRYTDLRIGLLALIFLVGGMFVVTHYGESWDEKLRHDYAKRSLTAYISSQPGILADEKGPFYSMLSVVGSKLLRLVFTSMKPTHGWHIMTYLSFILGVIFFYRLSRRLVEPDPALAATLLFSTQPILWGHAFINPKDIPFMAFFLASVVLGLDMVDRFQARRQEPAQKFSLGTWLTRDGAVIAGVSLGLCSDIRTLGPASGLLVAVYFLSKAGLKAVPVLLKYLGVAALTIFLFWPYLWKAPLSIYLNSAARAMNFNWNGNVLFAGKEYPATVLPSSYLPTLFSLQLTETAWVLILIGFILAVIALARRAHVRMDLLLLGAWFLAPVGAAVILRSTMYDNFRQYLFALPPLFVLAGLALQAVWALVKQKMAWFALFVGLFLLPALYWNIRLHPYEYIYFNSLAGGTRGAYHNYEMDYWATSFKEDMEFLNKVAPYKATVAIGGPLDVAQIYARNDLKLVLDPVDPFSGVIPDYAVLTTRYFTDQKSYPNSEIIFQVTREGAVLSVVKQIEPDDPFRRPQE